MNVLIIEDEHGAAQNLLAILNEINESINTLAVIETVRDAVQWIKHNPAPDAAFIDIHLADGLCFEIFEKAQVEFPVIFTTAYDQYAIRAFKVNSIDYILKPISRDAVEFALDKLKKIYKNRQLLNSDILSQLIRQLGPGKKYRKTFLIHYQDRMLPVPVSDFAYFYIKNGIVYGATFKQEKFVIDQKLDSIEEQIDPENFYRVNRQYIVSRKAIKEAIHYFNGRLKLKVLPTPPDELLISKAKASHFKNWLSS